MSTCATGRDYCNTIVANHDVSGLGIRIVVYVQTLLCMLTASWLGYHEKAVRDTCRSCYIISLGLIINAIVVWKTEGLSLYDGLIVTMLTTMMTSFASANTRYLRTMGLSISLSSFWLCAFWCYWGLQIWLDPWSFGLPPGRDCTANRDTVFVVFGHSVGATSRGLRGFALFFFAIGSMSALFALGRTIKWLYRYTVGTAARAKEDAAFRYAKSLHRKQQRRKSEKEKEKEREQEQEQEKEKEKEKKKEEGKEQAADEKDQPAEDSKSDRSSTWIYPIIRYAGLGGTIYIIITTEQIVARNPSVRADRNEWSYGQTFALIIILWQQICDILGYLREYALYQQAARKNREDLEASHKDGGPSRNNLTRDREDFQGGSKGHGEPNTFGANRDIEESHASKSDRARS